MTVPAQPLMAIHPEGMLTVTVQMDNGPLRFNVVSCRYLPATVQSPQATHRVVAIEVLHDPANPTPLVPYYCNPASLTRLVVPAGALLEVRPYVSA